MLEHKENTKEKLSVTMSPSVYQQVIQWQTEEKISSRSVAIEKLISKALQVLREQEFEQEVAEFYQSLPKDEQSERKEWANLSSEAFHARKDV